MPEKKVDLPTVGLDSDELNKAMKQLMQNLIPADALMNVSFLGVFAFDCVPLAEFSRRTSRTNFCIVNTDPANLPGKHWLALFKPHSKTNFEFFDSFGKPPSYYRFSLDERAMPDFSTLRLQSYNTRVCGHYCLLFLYIRIILAVIPANAPPCLLLKHLLPAATTLTSHSSKAAPSPLLYICKILQSQAKSFEARDAFIVHTLKSLLAISAFNSLSSSSLPRQILSHPHGTQSCAPFALGAVDEGDEEITAAAGGFQ